MILAVKCFQLLLYISFLLLECSFNGSVHDCHATPGLLRENEPGNEARIDSLCETLTGRILFTLYFRSYI